MKGYLAMIETKNKKINYKFSILFTLCIMFIILLLLSYWFPIVGDDWSDLTTIFSFSQIKKEWLTLNGRILGNTSALFFGHFTLLRAIVKATIIFCIVLFISKNSSVKSWYGFAFVFIYTLALPFPLFRQSYAWSAGFFNYVPPVLLILMYLSIIKNIFYDKKLYNTFFKIIVCFLLGVITQLFVENITIFTILLAICIVAWHKIKYNEFSSLTTIYLLGSIIGAQFMFSSPVYSNIANETGGYRTLSTNIVDLLYICRTNYGTFSTYLIKSNYLLLFSLIILLIIIIFLSKNSTCIKLRILKVVNLVLLVVLPVYFVISAKIFPTRFNINESLKSCCIDIFILIIFFVLILITLYYYIDDYKYKSRAILFWISSFTSVAPMLFVKPLGPRCFYISYVFIVVVITNLMKYIIEINKIKCSILKIALCIIFILVPIFFMNKYYYIHLIEKNRNNYIEKMMTEHKKTIYIPILDSGKYIHEPLDPKIYRKYFYQEPGDIEFKFIPYDEWFNLYVSVKN